MSKHLKTLAVGAAIAAGLAAAPALYAQDHLRMPHGSMMGQGEHRWEMMGGMMSGHDGHDRATSRRHDGALQRDDAGDGWRSRPAAQRPVAVAPARSSRASHEGRSRSAAPRGTGRPQLTSLERQSMPSLKPMAASLALLAASASTACRAFARRARSATRRPRAVLSADRQGGARLRARGRRRPCRRPRRPPWQGRGPALHLHELPGRLPAACRAHRRDPGDGQPARRCGSWCSSSPSPRTPSTTRRR